ncbi:hypothetical protein LO762_19130 [Actinocorallia sp. API 0066]|uniref:hypothetical protein n=1 Tax=Actinocorallia sp. API 0066 TaxID=2896846 RepID=UPI001E5FE419|nr:hypothetical protein [Actinocorallia sp. API 0066]MCD0451295.1 hypothetical protein [Actinocorallia sp. API 0066]
MKGPGIRALSVFALTAALVVQPTAALAAPGPRIDLKVLVVTDGQSPSVAALAARLDAEGVPFDLVDLSAPGRPAITPAFLQDTVGGAPRARYQGVILPNASPFADPAELTALTDFERRFGIRQISAYVYPTPEVGLNYPETAGTLDGTSAQLSPAAKAGAFRYLKGTIPFEDLSPTAPETYGYPATPLPNADGTTFQPFLTTGGRTLAGVHTKDGRSQLVLTFSANEHQTQFRALGHGLLTWLTKGVHLGLNRQYLSVHVDDVFARDARWSTEHDCTPGEDCADPEVATQDIRMTPDDVAKAVDWQSRRAFPLDMYFNGGGSQDEVAANGSDPLLTAFQRHRTKFRWANHTLDHTYLGCEQNYDVSPWACRKDAQGRTVWATRAYIRDQFRDNRTWAATRLLPLEADEVVTGEHSGLKLLPQQPEDNPNLPLAAADTGVKWLGADASRDFEQRQVGPALTVPRYPMANYFNVGTEAEMADEYNWIYTARADGGSGICEDNPQTVTCITPLDPATGYRQHIVPLDARITLAHILRNDPRPHYVHQSNLAEDRILYPLLDRVLDDYAALFDPASPLVNQRMRDNGAELRRQAAWRAARTTVTAYLQDGKVRISGAPTGVSVPVTVPEGTRTGLLNLVVFGEKYAGERSAYTTGTVTLTVGAATV